MRQSNRRILGLAAASALALGSAAAVVAAGTQGVNPYPGMMGGPGRMTGMGPGMMGMGPGMMGMMGSISDTTAWLAQIKNEIGITAAQEDAWKAYAQAVTNQSALMNAHRQTMWSGNMPPPADQRASMHQQGWQTMQQTRQATEDLYQALTPDQRAKADNLLPFQPGRGMAWFRR